MFNTVSLPQHFLFPPFFYKRLHHTLHLFCPPLTHSSSTHNQAKHAHILPVSALHAHSSLHIHSTPSLSLFFSTHLEPLPHHCHCIGFNTQGKPNREEKEKVHLWIDTFLQLELHGFWFGLFAALHEFF